MGQGSNSSSNVSTEIDEIVNDNQFPSLSEVVARGYLDRFSELFQPFKGNKLKTERENPQLLPLPVEFNAWKYLTANRDLEGMIQGLDESQCIHVLTNHFRDHGRLEGRLMEPALPFDFEPKMYGKLNPDLYSTCGSNDDALIGHYKSYGMREHRKYKMD